MKRFKVDGLWSTTREGKNMVPGFLRNGRSGLSLHLLGSFTEGWTPNALGRYEKIYGVIGQGLRRKVCHPLRLRDGIDDGEFIERAVGEAPVQPGSHRGRPGTEEPLKFDSLEYDFTYLDNWVGKSHVATEFPLGEGKRLRFVIASPNRWNFR